MLRSRRRDCPPSPTRGRTTRYTTTHISAPLCILHTTGSILHPNPHLCEQFGEFSDWVNVFKPGTGDITIWENTGGTRGAQIFQKKSIPLTPGPLVVALKVPSSQAADPSKYWPPSDPDAVETIAASYVQSSTTSKVRLFNLSPGVKSAGMSVGGKEIASGVAYSLGSAWVAVAGVPSSFSFKDDSTGKALTTRTMTPAQAPIGNTNMLIGLPGGSGSYAIQAITLEDAPEGGTCHP